MNKNIINSDINQRIKELRIKNNLTQKDFADRIGTTRASLGQIETFVANPTLELIIKIVKEFDVSYNELIDGQTEVNKTKNNDEADPALLHQENIYLKREIQLKDEIIESQKQVISVLMNAR